MTALDVNERLKTYLPYNILLGATLAACAMMVVFNLAFKGVYPVTIEYKLPAVRESATGKFDEKVPVLDYADDATLDSPDFSPGGAERTLEPVDAGEVTFPLEINLASMEEMMLIPRVGEVTASRIVQYRDVLGGYTSLEQLMEIKGIAETTFGQISAYFYISGDEWDAERGTDTK